MRPTVNATAASLGATLVYQYLPDFGAVTNNQDSFTITNTLTRKATIMKSKILAALIFTLPLVANAEWLDAGTSLGETYKLKVDSFVTHKGMHSMVLQTTSEDGKEIRLLLLGVSDKACKNEMGEVYTSKLNGDMLLKHDFVFGGESMGSFLAQKLCTFAANNK